MVVPAERAARAALAVQVDLAETCIMILWHYIAVIPVKVAPADKADKAGRAVMVVKVLMEQAPQSMNNRHKNPLKYQICTTLLNHQLLQHSPVVQILMLLFQLWQQAILTGFLA